MKYLERLNQDKEAKQTEANSLLNDEASIAIQTKILGVRKAQAENANLSNKLASKTTLDFDAMYEADVEGKVLAKRLEWLEAKKEELF